MTGADVAPHHRPSHGPRLESRYMHWHDSFMTRAICNGTTKKVRFEKKSPTSFAEYYLKKDQNRKKIQLSVRRVLRNMSNYARANAASKLVTSHVVLLLFIRDNEFNLGFFIVGFLYEL
jgi:hypothetical protein